MNVVFYDTTTRRAWLVGGDDALLHLSRAAISHPDGRIMRCHQNFPLSKRFKHADSMSVDFSTSQDVLLDGANRDIVIYDNERDPTEPWRFENEVREMFELLSEMGARRAKHRSCETKQWELRKPWIKQFVGIGCLDLISGEPILPPRCRELSNTVTHWLKIVDAIDTVNIIGAGLADMIQPTTKLRGSVELPIGQDILIAPTKRMSRIVRMYGTQHADCVEITRGVFWQHPMSSFHESPCHCDADGATGCCENPVVNLRDRRQTFLRGLRNSGMTLDQVLKMYPTSAVAFGSSVKTPESRSLIATRTSGAIYQILHTMPFRNAPVQSTTIAPVPIPEAPPTPGYSPLRIIQPPPESGPTSNNVRDVVTHTTATNKPTCTSSKAAQICLFSMVGRSDKAMSLIVQSMSNGDTAEEIDRICYGSAHPADSSKHLYESLLGYACRSGDVDFVQFLLQRQFPANKVNSLGVSPLEEAASRNYVRIMRQLLVSCREPAEIDKALMVAVRAGHESATELLSEHALRLDAALDEACSCGHIRLVHLLIDKGAEPNADYAKVFRDALAGGSVELVKALLEHDIDESLIVAMTEAMETRIPQSEKLPKDFSAKFFLLKERSEQACAPNDLEFIDFCSESSIETPRG